MFSVLVFDHSHSKITYTSGFFWVKRMASRRLGKRAKFNLKCTKNPRVLTSYWN